MTCNHTPSRVSVNGYYTCQRCFEQVRHPWAPEPRQPKPSEPETGIDRMAREADTDWLRQIGVSR